MIEQLGLAMLIMTGMYFVSNLCFRLIHKNSLGPFRTIFIGIGFFGVILHELSHYGCCIISRTPASGLKVRIARNYSGESHLSGQVSLDRPQRLSFAQAAFIGLAPLFVCTWAFMSLFDMAFTESVPIELRLLAGILSISAFLGAGPSSADMRNIRFGFSNDPRHAWYQVALISFSTLTLHVLVDVFQQEQACFLINEYLAVLTFLAYFIGIGVFYVLFKYSIKGSLWLFKFLTTRDKALSLANKRHSAMNRKNIRPKPYKQGEW